MCVAILPSVFCMWWTLTLSAGLRVIVTCSMPLPTIFTMVATTIVVSLLDGYVNNEPKAIESRLWACDVYGSSFRESHTMFAITVSGLWQIIVSPFLQYVCWSCFIIVYVSIAVLVVMRIIGAIFLKVVTRMMNSEGDVPETDDFVSEFIAFIEGNLMEGRVASIVFIRWCVTPNDSYLFSVIAHVTEGRQAVNRAKARELWVTCAQNAMKDPEPSKRALFRVFESVEEYAYIVSNWGRERAIAASMMNDDFEVPAAYTQSRRILIHGMGDTSRTKSCYLMYPCEHCNQFVVAITPTARAADEHRSFPKSSTSYERLIEQVVARKDTNVAGAGHGDVKRDQNSGDTSTRLNTFRKLSNSNSWTARQIVLAIILLAFCCLADASANVTNVTDTSLATFVIGTMSTDATNGTNSTQISTTCTDYVGWTDRRGNSCNSAIRCARNPIYVLYTYYSSFDVVSPNEACCACGGGRVSTLGAFQANASTSNDHAAAGTALVFDQVMLNLGGAYNATSDDYVDVRSTSSTSGMYGNSTKGPIHFQGILLPKPKADDYAVFANRAISRRLTDQTCSFAAPHGICPFGQQCNQGVCETLGDTCASQYCPFGCIVEGACYETDPLGNRADSETCSFASGVFCEVSCSTTSDCISTGFSSYICDSGTCKATPAPPTPVWSPATCPESYGLTGIAFGRTSAQCQAGCQQLSFCSAFLWGLDDEISGSGASATSGCYYFSANATADDGAETCCTVAAWNDESHCRSRPTPLCSNVSGGISSSYPCTCGATLSAATICTDDFAFCRASNDIDGVCKSCADVDCGWTQNGSCPDHVAVIQGNAGNNGSIEYECCCNQGLWNTAGASWFNVKPSALYRAGYTLNENVAWSWRAQRDVCVSAGLDLCNYNEICPKGEVVAPAVGTIADWIAVAKTVEWMPALHDHAKGDFWVKVSSVGSESLCTPWVRPDCCNWAHGDGYGSALICCEPANYGSVISIEPCPPYVSNCTLGDMSPTASVGDTCSAACQKDAAYWYCYTGRDTWGWCDPAPVCSNVNGSRSASYPCTCGATLSASATCTDDLAFCTASNDIDGVCTAGAPACSNVSGGLSSSYPCTCGSTLSAATTCTDDDPFCTASNDTKGVCKMFAPSTGYELKEAVELYAAGDQGYGIINSWDTSKVTDMSYLLQRLDFNHNIGRWNTARVTDMQYAFLDAVNFNQPLMSWNTSQVTNMRGVFRAAKSYNHDLNTWDTAKVTSMTEMFYLADSWDEPLNKWNTAHVTDMSKMFESASSFDKELNAWDTAKVTSMAKMFSYVRSYSKPLNDWNTAQVTSVVQMFYFAFEFNQDLNNWNIARVKYGSAMWAGASMMTYPKPAAGCSITEWRPPGYYIVNESDCIGGQRFPPLFGCEIVCADGYIGSVHKKCWLDEGSELKGCSECSVGTYEEENMCMNCTAGKFNKDTHSTTCERCPTGQYSTAGATICSSCADGQIPNEQQSGCDLCESGKAAIGGESSCTPCNDGQNASVGSRLCTLCQEGRVPRLPKKSDCEPCDVGTFSKALSTVCQSCDPGKIAGVSSSECYECEAGKMANVFECVICTAGTVSQKASAVCTPCEPGRYANKGENLCTPCPSGTFNPHFGSNSSTECRVCPAGRYSSIVGLESSAGCTECRQHMRSTAGSVSLENCSCEPGFYYVDADGKSADGIAIIGAQPESCNHCTSDENMVCPGGLDAPFAKQGYYMVGYNRAQKCKHFMANGASVCLEGFTFYDRKCSGFCSRESYDQKTFSDPEALIGFWSHCLCDPETLSDGSCVEGHTGILCGACAQGWTREVPEKECRPCTSLGDRFVLIGNLVSGLFFKTVVALFLAKSAISSALSSRKLHSTLLRSVQSWLSVMSVLAFIDFSDVSVFSWTADQLKSTSDDGDGGRASQHQITFEFPDWFDKAFRAITGLMRLMILGTQTSLECLIEPAGQHSVNKANEMKLFLPTAWWVVYPLLLSTTVALSVLILAKIGFRLSMLLGGDKKKLMDVFEKNGMSVEVANSMINNMSKKEIWYVLSDHVGFFTDRKSWDPVFRHGDSGNNSARNSALDQLASHKLRRYFALEFIQALSRKGDSVSEGSLMLEIVQGSELIKQRGAQNTGFTPEDVKAAMEDPAQFLMRGGLEKYFLDDKFQPIIFQKADVQFRLLHRKIDEKGSPKRVPDEYIIFGMFGSTRICKILVDSKPIMLVAIYSIWSDVTEVFMRAIQSTSFSVQSHDKEVWAPESHWSVDPRVLIWPRDRNHAMVFWAAIVGTTVWSFLFVIVIALIIRRHRRDKMEFIQLRNYGYFYNGLKPENWYWELAFKRFDMLLVYIVCYTPVITDPRAKMLIYAGFAGIALVAHLAVQPFDNRANNLCNRMEGQGLFVRFTTLCCITLLLILGRTEAWMSLVVCVFVLSINLYYVISMVIVIAFEIAGGLVNEKKTFDERIKTIPNIERVPKAVLKCAAAVHDYLFGIFSVFAAQRSYLEKRVPRIVWRGLKQPLQICFYRVADDPPSKTRQLVNAAIEWFYKLGNDRQVIYFSELMGSMTSYMARKLDYLTIPHNNTEFLIVFTLVIKELKRTEATMSHVNLAHECKKMLEQAHEMEEKEFLANPVTESNGGAPTKTRTTLTNDHLVFNVKVARSGYLDSNEFAFSICANDMCQAFLHLYKLTKDEIAELLALEIPRNNSVNSVTSDGATTQATVYGASGQDAYPICGEPDRLLAAKDQLLAEKNQILAERDKRLMENYVEKEIIVMENHLLLAEKQVLLNTLRERAETAQVSIQPGAADTDLAQPWNATSGARLAFPPGVYNI